MSTTIKTARPKPFTEFMAAVTNHKEPKLLRSSSTITLTQSEKGPSWSIKSLLQTLPESPSPICSSSSSTPYSSPSELFGPTESSSPKFRNPDQLDSGNQPPPSAEIHEWIELSTKLKGLKTCSPRQRLSNSSIYESALTAIHEIPSAKEAAALYHEDEIQEYRYRQPYTVAWNLNERRDEERDEGWDQERDKLTSRPKPYEAFLEEVKTQQLEAEIVSWRRAKHEELMNKLTRKEAAISDWEFRETMKALKDKKKLEGKLERSRARVLKTTQERISRAKEMANRKKVKARVSTVKKIAKITSLSDNTQTTRKSSWLLKLTMLIHK